MTTQGRINCTTLPPDETEHTNRSVCEQLKDEREWRVALEVIYGEVWDTSDLKRDFNVIGFLVPLVAVRRKDNGEEGTLELIAARSRGTPRKRRSSKDPAVIVSDSAFWMSCGSTPVTKVSPAPGARIGAWRTTATSCTPGVARTASATPPEKGWKP